MESATPMLKQYQHIKKNYQDCILFFRLGDFYEMFFDDAKVASSLLDLVLTSRGSDATSRIPMCGVPFHAAENYIAKLIKAGQKVAICEQVEDPAAAKGIVKRDVIRVVTAGTFFDDATDSRYLLSLSPNGKNFGIAFTDVTTGAIQTNQYTGDYQIIELLSKMPFYECIFPESVKDTVKEFFNHPLLKTRGMTLSPFGDWSFNAEMARKNLCDHFQTHSLKGFGIEELPHAQSSCGALLEYLKQMNKQPLKHIDRITLYTDDDFVFISPAAHYGLEMETLLETLDKTLTPMGRRQFRFWLYHPLKHPAGIRQRQEAVKILKDSPAIFDELGKTALRNIPDLEKSLSRLSCGFSAPKDILAIRNCLLRGPEIAKWLQTIVGAIHESPLCIDDLPQLRELLAAAINPEMPLAKPEGKIIRPGFNQELDGLRSIQDNGREWLKNYQAEEIKKTGINSLKIGYNNVFGYYIEITKANQKNVPNYFIRKQTLVNGERYITPELKEYEEKYLTAQEKILAIENRLVKEIQQAILNETSALHAFAGQIATIDCVYALGVLAGQPGYILPDVNDSTVLDIQDGRHPVVESTTTDHFIANDTFLNCDDSHLIILTGPNMAGKSTYIRQTAILVIMAQMGSYIPAEKAAVGVVDKIFTRIGAHDEIAKGQSTFMVEMTEAADILNNLTPRSLIILDEIGRGTSTYDGLSLAWALAEHLQSKKARTLFATHFHELTALADQFSGVKNYNVAVKEWKDKIIFLHKIVPGSTDDSYGIYVAKLAGIPESVIKRSKKILTELETGSHKATTKTERDQLNLFAPALDATLEEVKKTLAGLDVNSMTPVEALNTLNELKQKINNNKD
jgi:DNA mismatch repair protein MutS